MIKVYYTLIRACKVLTLTVVKKEQSNVTSKV